jgi:lipoprotein-anchoring transpeptidase ErfK/SrfK
LKNRLLAFIGISIIILAIPFQSVTAQASTTGASLEPIDSVCLPGYYISDSSNCVNLGPAREIADLYKLGITFPSTPFPFINPSPELQTVPYRYAKLSTEQVPEYNFVPSEPGETPTSYLQPGFKYISYSSITSNAWFYAENGYFIDGGDLSRVSLPSFQGVIVAASPLSGFGWLIEPAVPRAGPSLNQAVNGKTINTQTKVPVFQTITSEGQEWVMVGFNQWLPKSVVARVLIATQPPEGVTDGRWIEVNLYDQTLAVYDNNQLVFATLIASGLNPFFTRPGLFQITQKKPAETMSGGNGSPEYYYLEDVPWTMYYDGIRALHGAYWRTVLGYPASHGCVNLSVGDSRWLYDWAHEGDWVYVWDPSGRTPTDPAFYTQTGAW